MTEDQEQVLEIFRRIAFGEGNHGDFLRHFSEAYIRADSENRTLLTPTAIILVHKYGLQAHLEVSGVQPAIEL